MQNSLPLRLRPDASACLRLRSARQALQFDNPSIQAGLINYVLLHLDEIIVLSDPASIDTETAASRRHPQAFKTVQLNQVSVALNEIHGCLDEIRSAVISGDETVIADASTRKVTEEFVDRISDSMQDIMVFCFALSCQRSEVSSAKAELLQAWMGYAHEGVGDEIANHFYVELLNRMQLASVTSKQVARGSSVRLVDEAKSDAEGQRYQCASCA